MRRVVVTGMGIVSSIGNNTQEVLASPARGEVRHHAMSPNSPSMASAAWSPVVPTLDAAGVVDRRAMRFHGGGSAWNHVAMDQAIRDSGLEEPARSAIERTGIVMGSGGPSTTRPDRRRRQGARQSGPEDASAPSPCPRAMSSTASATLATWFKIKGVNYSISSACATSNHRIGNAYELIQLGKQDVIFAGGCEELDWTLSVLFDAMGAMSSDFNGRRRRASRAYDVSRDGFVIAGGAGVVVLEELEHAQGRAARKHLWRDRRLRRDLGRLRHGRPRVRARCAACAWRFEGVKPKVDYINLHAHLDPRSAMCKEIEAIREVFGAGDKSPPISATKSLTGHSLGATGVQEAIYSLLMLNNDFICESAHIEELDPAFADMPIVRKRIDNAGDGHSCSPTPSASAAPTRPVVMQASRGLRPLCAFMVIRAFRAGTREGGLVDASRSEVRARSRTARPLTRRSLDLDADFARCFQIMECDDIALRQQWALRARGEIMQLEERGSRNHRSDRFAGRGRIF